MFYVMFYVMLQVPLRKDWNQMLLSRKRKYVLMTSVAVYLCQDSEDCQGSKNHNVVCHTTVQINK